MSAAEQVAQFCTGDAVTVKSGANTGRIGTVVGVNRHSGRVVVELLVPKYFTDPTGPQEVAAIPYSAQELELASGADVPGSDGRRRRFTAPVRDDADAPSRAACTGATDGHYRCPRHRPMAYAAFARHRAGSAGAAA